MAYEFKKLSEVEKLDSVPDGASVLAEVDGVIRRVPGSGLGGGGSTRETIFEEQTLEFASDTEEFNGLYVASNIMASTMLVVGETYTVVWDGDSYSCVAQDVSAMSDGAIAVGNGSAFGLSGDNEPFAIATSLLEDSGEVFVIASFLAVDGSTSTSHTVAIYKEAASSGGVSSWNDLTDKPFGEGTRVIFEGVFQDTLLDNDGDGTKDAWDGLIGIEDTSDTNLVVGKNYTVTWDGAVYECECFLASGLPSVGNTMMSGGTNNKMPFVIVRDTSGVMALGSGWFAVLVEPPTDLTISGTYSCKIELNDIKHLDNKYLNFMDKTDAVETELMSEQTVDGFEYNEVDDVHFAEQTGVFELVASEKYRVVWDGEEFEYTAFSTNTGFVGMGDLSYDPFLMGTADNIVQFMTTSTASSHTIAIYHVTEAKDYIKPEYIPGPPYFDLTAMGLPAIPLDGTAVSVECDTTEFRAAAAKGLIKTKIYISVPGFGDMPVENLVPMAYLIPTNTYGYAGSFVLDNTPFVISCGATDSSIHASAFPLMTATT